MKRFLLMSFFLLGVGFLAAGYSDSSDIDKVPTYQVAFDNSDFSGATLVNAPALHAAIFVLDSPELGKAGSEPIFYAERSANRFDLNIRPPPDRRQKSEYKI